MLTRSLHGFLFVALVIGLCGTGGVAAQGSVPRENTLIIAWERGEYSGPPDVANPYLPATTTARGIHQTMAEHLFYLNYETGELVPWLATGYSANDDFTEYTITLREGVEWSDGWPFTAADVVFTVNMLMNNPTLTWGAAIQSIISSVEEVDDLTVKMTLTRSAPRFIYNNWAARIWGGPVIVPEHIWADQDPTTFRNFDLEKGWPVFTGAYTLTSASENEFIYDRNDDWWGVKTGFQDLPAPARIIFVEPGPEESAAAKIQNNQVDSLAILNIGAFEVVKARNPNVIGWSEDAPYGYIDPCPQVLEFNTQVPPWDDPQMRQALSYTVDRAFIANLVYEGKGVPAQFLFPPYPAIQKYLDEVQDLFDMGPYRQDLNASAAIMESKGFTKKDGVWVGADGRPVVVRLMMLTPQVDATWGPATLGLTQSFEEGGFKVEQVLLDIGPFIEQRNLGQWDVRMSWACGSVTEPFNTLDNFHSRFVVPIGERADNNHARWANEEYSALVDQMGMIPPESPETITLFRQAMEIFLSEIPTFGLYQAVRINPFNTTYWTNWPTAENNYIQPPSWWAQTYLIIQELQPAQ